MSFFTIHTKAGLGALYAALQSGNPVTVAEVAVGDGGGDAVTPEQSQTTLVNEVYRAAVNRVFKPDPTGQPSMYAVELVIPVSAGGFTIREVGAYDDDGTLIAVGSLPETYKAVAADGAFGDTVVRLHFQALNADQITLTVNGAAATQDWVLQAVNPAVLFPGGTTGQVLVKNSNADGDTRWADPTEANVVVDVIEERQLLDAGQTDVTLTLCTTSNLAIYIDGQRVPNAAIVDGWQDDPVDDTHVILGQSYPQDTEIIAVQNEPTGNLDGFLRKEKNLADLASIPTARQVLGVPSLPQMYALVPPGAVMDFAMEAAPSGWIECDGRELDRTTYTGLFAAIGTVWGDGNGVDTFNVPDLRGEFRRSWDHGRGIDAGRGFATHQGDRMQNHFHGTGVFNASSNDDWYGILRKWAGSMVMRWVAGESGSNRTATKTVAADDAKATGTTDQVTVAGTETRPRNVAVLTCIKV
ncbi:phage tail protein [Thioclava sp.]|uniref:phage tail-collar fiber domain-containing protein n=1 Tax=Thioclava sp. TaxID=1933450 RepID=UPI003242C083